MVQSLGERVKGIEEMALPPGVYVFMQDATKGGINTFVGPTAVAQQAQLRPVLYDPQSREFDCDVALDEAVQKFIFAKENEYIVLRNPSQKQDKAHPPIGDRSTDMPDLAYGETEVISGPASFALWPMQDAKVIPGHHLRTDQYVLVRILDETKAKANWKKTVIKKAESDGEEVPKEGDIDFSTGNLINIKGTQAKFFIPCTGVEVVPDENQSLVREAITLEQLEYCILVDQNGKKRYERGPQVVFPEPTEIFYQDDEGNKKFKAIELSPISGLHIKVIAPYEEDGKKYEAGTELFITGDTKERSPNTAIYFPRAEHSIIRYGKQKPVHYATAIPLGEGRYVMDRRTAQINTVQGETMLLCNPITHVIVRRILNDSQIGLWFPGSKRAKDYNHILRSQSSTANRGYIEENEAIGGPMQYATAEVAMPDSFTRGSTYSPPRSITLDTFGQGAVPVCPWTGFAVQIVSKKIDDNKQAKREVVVGPNSRLLDYDEDLEVLRLSTGKPKNTDRLQETVYLRILNNQVGDIIQDLMSQDGVPCEVKLSLRVNFLNLDEGGNPNKWFNVENYVKLLCDRVRSMLKGYVRTLKIETFYNNYVPLIRDFLLGKHEEGKSRPGMFFEENCMKLVEVDVLGCVIKNEQIAKDLQVAQTEVVAMNINSARDQRMLEATQHKESISQEIAKAKATTVALMHQLDVQEAKEELEVALTKLKVQFNQEQLRMELVVSQQAVLDQQHQSELDRDKAKSLYELSVDTDHQALFLARLNAESQATVDKFNAAKEGLVQALITLGDKVAAATVAEALNPMNLISRFSGDDGSFTDLLKQFVPGLENSVGHITNRIPGAKVE